MARKAEWLVRLPLVLDRLRAATSVAIPAGTLADMLKINLRRAQQLCQPFASPEFGGMAERKRLIAGLQAIAKGDAEDVEAEVQRRAKLREVLTDAAHDLFLHAAKIEPAPGYMVPDAGGVRGGERVKKKLRATMVEDLPPTIQLARHSVTITCTDAYDLFSQVREMTYAAANDLDRLAGAIEGEAVVPAPPASYYLRADERGEIFIETVN